MERACLKAQAPPRPHLPIPVAHAQVQQDIFQAKVALTGVTAVLRFLQLLCKGHFAIWDATTPTGTSRHICRSYV